jgi:hypothetical protein
MKQDSTHSEFYAANTLQPVLRSTAIFDGVLRLTFFLAAALASLYFGVTSVGGYRGNAPMLTNSGAAYWLAVSGYFALCSCGLVRIAEGIDGRNRLPYKRTVFYVDILGVLLLLSAVIVEATVAFIAFRDSVR